MKTVDVGCDPPCHSSLKAVETVYLFQADLSFICSGCSLAWKS